MTTISWWSYGPLKTNPINTWPNWQLGVFHPVKIIYNPSFLVGGLVEPPQLKNMLSRQIGSLNPKDRGENSKNI